MLSNEFLLAGDATFTVSNDVSRHYTYRIWNIREGLWGVSLLTGPDNTADYTYIGCVYKDSSDNLVFTTTKKSRVNYDSASVKVLIWALLVIGGAKPLPEGYDIQHNGRCGRCGRNLTDPDSIAAGLGPICINA